MKYFTFFLLTFTINKLQAQLEFAPVGAKWTYEAAYGDWFGNVGYSIFIIESEKDTLIQNKTFKKLKCYTIDKDLSNNRIKYEHPDQFIIQDKYKVYHLIKDSTYQIYDFNPTIGMNHYYLGWNIIFEHFNISQLEYKIVNKLTDSSYTFLPNKIEAEITCSVGMGYKIYFYEKFGYLSDIHFYSDSYCITDQGMPFTLRCYEDPSVGLIKFDTLDCDSIKPDIIRINSVHLDSNVNSISLIQKSNNDLIVSLQNEGISSYKVYSTDGKLIINHRFQHPEKTIQFGTEQLPIGIYILQIVSEHRAFYALKFLNN